MIMKELIKLKLPGIKNIKHNMILCYKIDYHEVNR